MITPHSIDQNDIAAGAVLISPDDASPFAVNMQTSDHELTADEPPRLGGKNAGPTPYDFLHSGLGSCTAITMRYYAKKNSIPLDDFHVIVSSYRNAERDLVLVKELVFDGGQSDEIVDQLIAASKRCPMHKDLIRSIDIETTIRRS